MKKYVLAGLLLVTFAHFALADPVRIDIPEINKYYSDYNYIVAYSTPAERRLLAHAVGGKKLESSILKDSRLKTLYEMMKGLRAAELDQDPSIVWGNRLGEDLLYAKIPVAVSGMMSNHLSVHTVRRAVGNWWQDGIAGMPDLNRQRFDPRSSGGFSYPETDYWVRVGGKWRISSLHFYLIRE